MKKLTKSQRAPKAPRGKARQKKTPTTAATTASDFQAKAGGMGRILAVCVVAFLVLGASLGVLSFFRPPTVEAAPTADPTASVTQDRAGAYASDLLGAWLGATRDDSQTLQDLYPAAHDAVTAKEPVEYRDLEVVSVSTDEYNLSTVTLSTSIKTTVDTGDKDTERWIPQWFTVPVAGGDQPVAMGLPSPVERPQVGQAPPLAYQKPLSNADVRKTIQDFLAAYATGNGDVTRFTSPNSSITAITPTPYTGVSMGEARTVEDLGAETPSNGAEARVLVPVTLESQSGKRQAEYALTLTVRDGRWEVQSVDPRPLINTN